MSVFKMYRIIFFMAEDSECKTDNFDDGRQPSLGQTEEVESELVRESGNNTAMLGQDVSLVAKKKKKKITSTSCST